MKKQSERLWTTVQRTENDQMSKCFFSTFFKKIKNNPPAVSKIIANKASSVY